LYKGKSMSWSCGFALALSVTCRSLLKVCSGSFLPMMHMILYSFLLVAGFPAGALVLLSTYLSLSLTLLRLCIADTGRLTWGSCVYMMHMEVES
jgi:hypothetical protein